jgi:hypothetical protein
MMCWRCHSNSVNTRNRLPICSDVKTRNRRNVVGIDMIRNNRIKYFIANNRILQFTSRNSVTSLFSLATTDIDLARLSHNTYSSALFSAFRMMNWPNKFLIWSSTSTLALSIGTVQRNAPQITHKRRYFTMYLISNNKIATDQCWKSFNCRYNPRMDYAFCLITLKRSDPDCLVLHATSMTKFYLTVYYA